MSLWRRIVHWWQCPSTAQYLAALRMKHALTEKSRRDLGLGYEDEMMYVAALDVVDRWHRFHYNKGVVK